MPRGIKANVGISGVDRGNFLQEESDVYGGDCKVILSKNQKLRDAFSGLSDSSKDAFMKPTDFQRRAIMMTKVRTLRNASPSLLRTGWNASGEFRIVAETMAAESGCLDRDHHHGCYYLD
jgi:hypothetical protein